MVAMFALSLGRLRAARLAGRAGLVLHRRSASQPNLAAPNDALALLLFMLALPVFGFFVVAAARAAVAQARVRGRRLRLRAGRAARDLRQRAAQAVRGQRLDADARPAVRALLLLAPAGRRAAGGAAGLRHRADPTDDTLRSAPRDGRGDERERAMHAHLAGQRLALRRRRDREDLRFQALPRRSPSWTRWPGSPRRGPPPATCGHYNRCVVRFNTHSVGGISRNDFICAAKADALSLR